MDFIKEISSPLFFGIKPEDMMPMLHCIGYHIRSFSKGEMVAFEGENLKYIGIVLSGSVDMVKGEEFGRQRYRAGSSAFICLKAFVCLLVRVIVFAVRLEVKRPY